MEQRGVLLKGIASVLNAGGSALLTVYDAVASIKTIVIPGEKETLSAQLREYEKKLERLYTEIGKEVVLRADRAEDVAHLSAAGEAVIKRAAEYQAEIDNIRQRMQKIEAEVKTAAAVKKEAAPESTSKPVADTEEIFVTELPDDSPVLAEAASEETNAVPAEEAETPAPEMAAGSAESAEPEAVEESTVNTPEESADLLTEVAATPGPEMVATEAAATGALEELLKSELLKICREKGIEANQRMTKAEIIALISGCS